MFSRNFITFIFILSSLVVGLIIGYSVGIKNIPKSQEIIFYNSAIGNLGKTKTIITNITAKDAYNIALNESRLWPLDVYLFGIELISEKFDEKGLSSGWKVMFYSKSKNKIYEVVIKDGESRGTMEKNASAPLQTLKGQMIDSEILAKSFFGLYPADTKIISLKMHYDESSKKFLWIILFPNGNYTIDAEN